MKDSISKPTGENPLWRTVSENLIRYQPSGTYYARLRVNGKLLRKSLETKSITVARMKLSDFEKEERTKAARTGGDQTEKMTFGDALQMLRENGFRPLTPRTKKDKIVLKPRALAYYEERVKALLKDWPELERTKINSIRQADLEKWSNGFLEDRSATAHNHTLGLLRNVFEIAVERGATYENPAKRIIRATEKPKKLILPTREQFEKFVREIETAGSGHSRPAANLVRFLAYGGFRKDEVPYITWHDCDFSRGNGKGAIRVRGNPETGTKGTDENIRWVPMFPEMRELLLKLRERRKREPETKQVMECFECQGAMNSAYQRVEGMARITHHDLRHLFATRCIESGIDIPTVSRWLGHKDGGVLCMKIYGHIADEHSLRMASRVSFAPITEKPANIVELRKEAVNE